MERFLNWLFKRHRTIHNCEGKPYLTRWHLFSTRWFTVMLHKFHRSDEDRALHDHPWSFASVILWPGYYEVTEVKSYEIDRKDMLLIESRGMQMKRKLPGMILWRPAEWRHRVQLFKNRGLKAITTQERTAWTLVVHFARRREWFYHYSDGTKVHHATWWAENCE